MYTASGTGADSTSSIPQEQQAKEELGKALGRLASGVYIMTLEQKGHRIGLLATWIAQAAFEPPMLTVAINKQRPIHQYIEPGAAFTINVLSNKNMDVFKAFAKPAQGVDDDRFAGLELLENPTAGPVFSVAISYLNCEVRQVVEAGDHVVVLAEVKSGKPLNIDAEPMVHLRKNGFQY